MILQACLFRESSSKPLCFERSDYPQMDPEADKCFITIRQENGKAVKGRVPLGYFGDVEEEYEKRNQALYWQQITVEGEASMEKELTASVVPCSASR